MLNHLEYYNFIQDHLVNPFIWDKPIFDVVTPDELAEFRKEIKQIESQKDDDFRGPKKQALTILKRFIEKLDLPETVEVKVGGRSYQVSIGLKIAKESIGKIDIDENLPEIADKVLMASYHLMDMLKAGIGDWESTDHIDPRTIEKRKNFRYARSARPFVVQEDNSPFRAILVLRRNTQPEGAGKALAYIIEVEGSKIFEGKVEKLKGNN